MVYDVRFQLIFLYFIYLNNSVLAETNDSLIVPCLENRGDEKEIQVCTLFRFIQLKQKQTLSRFMPNYQNWSMYIDF